MSINGMSPVEGLLKESRQGSSEATQQINNALAKISNASEGAIELGVMAISSMSIASTIESNISEVTAENNEAINSTSDNTDNSNQVFTGNNSTQSTLY